MTLTPRQMTPEPQRRVVLSMLACAVLLGLATTVVDLSIPAFLWALAAVALSTRLLDGWQLGFITLLVLLIGAESSQWSTLIPEAAPFTAAAILLVYAAVTSTAGPVRNSRHRSFTLLLCCFAAYSACSAIWSIDPLHSLKQVVAAVAVIGVPLLASHHRWVYRELMAGDIRLLYWVLSGGITLGLVLPTATGSGRVSGLFPSANSFASIAAMAFALGLGVAGIGRLRRVYLLTQTILAAAIVASGSRTGVVALAVALAWWASRSQLFSRERWKATASAVLGALAIILVLQAWQPVAIAQLTERFDPTRTRSLSYLSSREDTWEIGAAYWAERPLFGHGYRVGEVLFEQEAGGELIGSIRARTTHNGFLQVLLESGVTGLALVVGAIAVAVCSRGPTDGSDRRLWLSTSAALVAGLATQWTRSSILGVGSVFCITFWATCCATITLARNRAAIPAASVRSAGETATGEADDRIGDLLPRRQ